MKFNDKGIMVEKRNQPVNFFKQNTKRHVSYLSRS